jgi:hypothetical protein
LAQDGTLGILDIWSIVSRWWYILAHDAHPCSLESYPEQDHVGRCDIFYLTCWSDHILFCHQAEVRSSICAASRDTNCAEYISCTNSSGYTGICSSISESNFHRYPYTSGCIPYTSGTNEFNSYKSTCPHCTSKSSIIDSSLVIVFDPIPIYLGWDFSLQISIFLYNIPMTVKIHPSWKEALKDEFEKPYW